MSTEIGNLASKFKNHEVALKRAKEMHSYFGDTIHDKFVVVTDMAFEAVGIRFCQQIQENAKGEGFVSVLPEANHNMIESYYEKHDTNFIFLNSGSNDRVSKRFDFVEGVLYKL
jgi:glucose/mannose-6-phosphate isomerase